LVPVVANNRYQRLPLVPVIGYNRYQRSFRAGLSRFFTRITPKASLLCSSAREDDTPEHAAARSTEGRPHAAARSTEGRPHAATTPHGGPPSPRRTDRRPWRSVALVGDTARRTAARGGASSLCSTRCAFFSSSPRPLFLCFAGDGALVVGR
jgi:hypothetical protein